MAGGRSEASWQGARETRKGKGALHTVRAVRVSFPGACHRPRADDTCNGRLPSRRQRSYHPLGCGLGWVADGTSAPAAERRGRTAPPPGHSRRQGRSSESAIRATKEQCSENSLARTPTYPGTECLKAGRAPASHMGCLINENSHGVGVTRGDAKGHDHWKDRIVSGKPPEEGERGKIRTQVGVGV